MAKLHVCVFKCNMTPCLAAVLSTFMRHWVKADRHESLEETSQTKEHTMNSLSGQSLSIGSFLAFYLALKETSVRARCCVTHSVTVV